MRFFSRSSWCVFDPATYPTLEGVRAWVDQGVLPVIGYHPRLSSSKSNLSKLEEVLKYPGVVF
jgi:hypothetical protein